MSTVYFRLTSPGDFESINGIKIISPKGETYFKLVDDRSPYAGQRQADPVLDSVNMNKVMLVGKSLYFPGDKSFLMDLETGKKVDLGKKLYPFWVSRHDCPE